MTFPIEGDLAEAMENGEKVTFRDAMGDPVAVDTISWVAWPWVGVENHRFNIPALGSYTRHTDDSETP